MTEIKGETKETTEVLIQKLIDELRAKMTDKSFGPKEQGDLVRKIIGTKSWLVIEPLEKLIHEVKCPDITKVKILEELGKFGEPRVIRILTDYVKDKSNMVKNAAIKGLSMIVNPKCIQPLLDSLEDPDKWNRIFAIHGLQKNENKKIVKGLVDRLGDSEDQVRQEALQTLEKLRKDYLIEDVVAGLASENRFVKLGTATLIGSKLIEEGAPGLIKLLDGEDRRLAIIAARSLEKIGNPGCVPKLLIKAIKEAGYEGALNNIFTLSIYNMGEIAINPLIISYLASQDEKIKAIIIKILKKFGDRPDKEIEEMLLSPENQKNVPILTELRGKI
jgi:HEAT repeat protein